MKHYMEANEKGFGGVADAEAEMWFNLSGESTAVFTAKEGEEVVAATTIWGIGDGRSATENIFTVPEYRHQNIARATVAYALKELKNRGEKHATLTCLGDNYPAIQMYLSMGYELKYFLIEMCEKQNK